jgi:hypothetical protein
MSKHLNKSPREFRQMLEVKLKQEASAQGWPEQRARKRLAFERFLVRVQDELGEAVTLKGGVALELRVERARATLDVDLHVYGSPDELLLRLNLAGQSDARRSTDRFSFVVSVPKVAEIRNEALEYGGVRLSVRCDLDGKEFERFSLDASFAEEMFDVAEERPGSEVLGYLGVERPRLRIYPLTTHVAEKLHAYTLPEVEPTRLKDLPDIALLAQQAEGLAASRLREVIRQKFALRERNTRVNRGDAAYLHPVPTCLPAPPVGWEEAYRALALADALEWATLAVCYAAAQGFLDPMLSGCEGCWSVVERRWV